MPQPGCAWWHLVLHTKGSWLHGDPRGFRTRDHRIHSSGDYKHLPPRGEHERLHHFQKTHATNTILIPTMLYPIVGNALHHKCQKMDMPTLAISIGSTHAHLQIQLENNYRMAQQITAKLKQAASHAIRNQLPGTIWARGGKPILIRNQSHHNQVFNYICNHDEDGDWTWNYKEDIPDSQAQC